MSRPLSEQIGSTLAHIQDLIDTLIHGLLSSFGKNKSSKVMTNIKDAGDAYYDTYTKIKNGEKES